MNTIQKEFHFKVNGKAVSVTTDPKRFLLSVVREELGLTAAKHGCDIGSCGACTMLINGQAVKTCIYEVEKADGANIQTLEGISREGYLHPLQDAWLRHGASQCGYSTPGMIMAAKALLDKNPNPTREQIARALTSNICRCTGYQQICDAVMDAAGVLRQGITQIKLNDHENIDGVIGKSCYSKDNLDKVTGQCKYTADYPWLDALTARVVRSSYPHARILKIHTEEAKRINGVAAVFTHEDIPGSKLYGKAMRDEPVLAFDKVRYIGDPVVLIVAENQESANRAADLVKVDYEILPAVFNAVDALKPDAPIVHDGPEAYQDFVHEEWLNPRKTGKFHPNVLYYFPIRKGNVSEGFAKSDKIIERTYSTPWIEHACMEMEVSIALPTEDGGVKVNAPSQNVYLDRREIADVLGLEKEKVQVIQLPMGAAYGKREDMFGQILVSLAAFKLKKPVKLLYSREETFACTTKRYPMTMKYKTGVTKDGKILAFEAKLLVEKGAYASWGPSGLRKSTVHAAGPYEIPNVKIDGYSVYTNNVPAGPMRGFGATEVAFAHEVHMDVIAHELGINPIEFRKRNLIPSGGKTVTGQILNTNCTAADTMEAALQKFQELSPLPPPKKSSINRGFGLATMMYGIGYGHGIPDIGSSIVELNIDGTVTVRTSAVDYGQGLLTAFSQIIAEVVGIPLSHVRIITGNTHESPDSGSSVATRQTYVSGNAVKAGAEKLRESILEYVSKKHSTPVNQITIKNGFVSPLDLPLKEIAQQLANDGIVLKKQGRFRARTKALDQSTGQGDAYWPYAFGTQIAEVDVDMMTGQIKLLRMVAAHNVGKALNLNNVLGQIYGGIGMGIGMALLEDFKIEDGKPISDNFDSYIVPRAAHIPKIHAVVMEIPEPTGPFGAVGIGEPSTVPTAPAIINAIANATNHFFYNTPVTPSVIKFTLSKK